MIVIYFCSWAFAESGRPEVCGRTAETLPSDDMGAALTFDEDGVRAAVFLERRPIVRLPVDSLLPADSPRLDGERADHIRLLVESHAHFPPIIVHRSTMRVIDGMHRLRAAALRGDASIEARFFDGAVEDAFVIAVEMNVRHGLPLSLPDRKAAAGRIVVGHPELSDRAISAITSLSARSVKAVRDQLTGKDGRESSRVGRDGRVRPLNSATGRELAAALLIENPHASLREIARAAGLAPSTVMDVRDRLRCGQDPVPSSQRRQKKKPGRAQKSAEPRSARSADTRDPVADWAALQKLRKDPSLRFSETGRILLNWLSNQPEREQWKALLNSIPPHCLESVLQVAQANARAWQEFTEQLKGASGGSRAAAG
ncbi:ParB/RepB/Spo0J family partition protein [Streptantibioticus parmotrematis]|uniref:ParB/RepB/Spo0J family partition protein n=1 Tax=Streptantibioticus parmotrematis TaxID=2873249 RepID=UPI0033C6EBDB